MGVRTKAKNEGNLFILMDRTSTGYTTSTIDAFYKREDEKYVTEQAYDNPKFVEDVLREIFNKKTQVIPVFFCV